MYEDNLFPNNSNSEYRDLNQYQPEQSSGQGPAIEPGPAMGPNPAVEVNPPQMKQEKPEKQKKPGGFFRKAVLSVSLGLLFGLFAGIGFYAGGQAMGLVNQETASKNKGVESMGNNFLDTVNQDARYVNANNITVVESDISQMVEEVMPAMVSVLNTTTTEMQFFGQKLTQSTPYSGSGIIVGETDEELLIATNYHVVEGADKLEVTFIDDATVEAQIKGLDEDMDLAVIAVPLSAIDESTRNAVTVATLGNSDTLRLGEPVVAIGNALGYGQSVTNGIISALNRELTLEDGGTAIYIQTNAAINGGNSGGALLNVKGEVIGINSAKIGGSMVEGMGYAIPISSASPIIADLMEHRTRTQVEEGQGGYLGISLQAVDSYISQAYNMPMGIYVVSTEENSAAQNAGILPGDIITKFDGQKITSYEDLQEVLRYCPAGVTAKATIMRPENGEYVEYQLEVTLGSRPTNSR